MRLPPLLGHIVQVAITALVFSTVSTGVSVAWKYVEKKIDPKKDEEDKTKEVTPAKPVEDLLS